MFNKEELLLIFTDQKEFLEGVHIGDYLKCSSVMNCPLSHFDEDVEDIFLRQGIINKISSFAANGGNNE